MTFKDFAERRGRLGSYTEVEISEVMSRAEFEKIMAELDDGT